MKVLILSDIHANYPALEAVLNTEKISDKLKSQFKHGKKYGKIRGLTLVMNKKQNVEFAKELISIKLQIK